VATATLPPAATATPRPAATATPPPTAAATSSARVAEVSFAWDPAVVPPSDADDVAVIAGKLKETKGIVNATGDEQGFSVFYDPAVVTIPEIMEAMKKLGHPVIRK
jgi:hypothetical protein